MGFGAVDRGRTGEEMVGVAALARGDAATTPRAVACGSSVVGGGVRSRVGKAAAGVGAGAVSRPCDDTGEAGDPDVEEETASRPTVTPAPKMRRADTAITVAAPTVRRRFTCAVVVWVESGIAAGTGGAVGGGSAGAAGSRGSAGAA
ncbi:MAG: hypothetical protein ACM3QU_13765 [Verrucomicrobiota bacterium]